MKLAQVESSFAQKARRELVEIETKLDRLLDLQLNFGKFSPPYEGGARGGLF